MTERVKVDLDDAVDTFMEIHGIIATLTQIQLVSADVISIEEAGANLRHTAETIRQQCKRAPAIATRVADTLDGHAAAIEDGFAMTDQEMGPGLN